MASGLYNSRVSTPIMDQRHTYPRTKKRVVSQNLRSVGQSRRISQSKINIIIFRLETKSDSVPMVRPYDIRTRLRMRIETSTVMRR